MRLDAPRIDPVPPEQWNDKARDIMQPFVDSGRDFNIFRTLMNHPDLAKRWLVFASHILDHSTLPDRERELLILRTGHVRNAGYEWKKHADISRYLGISEADIESSKTGADTAGLSEQDRLLFMAADELLEDAFIEETTWAGLSEYFSTQQLMDLVFTVGQYNLVCMALNSFGVQHDE